MSSNSNDFYQFRKVEEFSKTTKFLWWCCGADKNILAKCTFADHVKYACLGGIVFATGFMAAIAGGFAFYIIFSPKGDALNKDAFSWGITIASIIFGIVWGNIIFNLDRYIVASTGKGDGTEKITKTEFLNALPRIFMGTIIALTISKPLEIRIFKSEIDAELQKKQNIFRAQQDSLTNAKYDVEIALIQGEIDTLTKEETVIQQRIDAANLGLAFEMSKQGGYGPEAKKYEQTRDSEQQRKDQQHALNKDKYDELQKRKNYKIQQKDEELVSNNAQKAALDGLMQRIKISHELSPTISWLITLLFLAIELTPIFFKLMVIKGPYDYLEENTKELIIAMQGIQKIHSVRTDKQGKEFEAETTMFYGPEKIILEKAQLLKAQVDISSKLADRWRTEQLAEIEKQIENSKHKLSDSEETVSKRDNSPDA
ncbi:MAG TPA: DUF4407 domain-containing protein [Ferruginibacter sp.]|nr:DUF4407 domain-containing protein [Ferruginibacter sp.]